MEFKAIISLLTLLTFYVEFLESIPIFGEEFVHIKVHVPKNVANTRGILKSTVPGSPQYPHTSHKVIHHYHRRRKPFKKSSSPSTAPQLEGIILAELDKPHADDPDEETFVVKKVPTDQRIKTYEVLEESIEKPSHNTHKVVEISPEYNKDHVETYRIIENDDHKQHDYEYVDKPHVERVKEYIYEKPRKETVKIIVSPSEHYKDHKNHHHDHHYHTHDGDESTGYHYKTPHVETVEIIKSKKSLSPNLHYENDESEELHSKYYEHDESEDYNPSGYHRDSIEIIKTKHSPKNHHSLEYETEDHNDFKPQQKEIIQVEKEIIYTKPREEYEYHRESVKPSYSYISKEQKLLEHEKPSIVYREHHKEHHKPFVVYREYKKSENSSPTRLEHHAYDTKEDIESEYHYSPAHTDSYHTDHGEESYYYEKSPGTTAHAQRVYHESRSHAEGHSSSGVAESDKANYHTKTSTAYSNAYASGQQYATYPQTTFTKDLKTQSSSNYGATYSALSSSYSQHDGLYGKLLPDIVEQPSVNSNIDWPDGVDKSQKIETYKGSDSYSADHAQGVGSGGYHYPPQ